jgi:hypothetical protein
VVLAARDEADSLRPVRLSIPTWVEEVLLIDVASSDEAPELGTHAV